jgi:hypothetical protein
MTDLEELKAFQEKSKLIIAENDLFRGHGTYGIIGFMKFMNNEPIECKYIGRSTSQGYIVCSFKEEILEDLYIRTGCAKYLWKSINKEIGHTYKINEALFHFDASIEKESINWIIKEANAFKLNEQLPEKTMTVWKKIIAQKLNNVCNKDILIYFAERKAKEIIGQKKIEQTKLFESQANQLPF